MTEAAPGGTFQTLHGPVIDQPLARSGEYFTPNHISSTTTLTNGAGDPPTVTYTYGEPFGEFTVTGSSSNTSTFTGREYDAESFLFYYRSRYYNGGWGRFLSEDPIGFAGGLNQYAYCGNNPINRIDPLGLDWLNDTANFAAGAGDSLTVGGTDIFRSLIGQNETVDHSSGGYFAGGASELLFEVVVTGGSALLKNLAAKASRKLVREQAEHFAVGALRPDTRNMKVFIHHRNPLFGHPGGAGTLFPLGGLPGWLHSGGWNLRVHTGPVHRAQHAWLQLLEAVLGRTMVNPYLTAVRAARVSYIKQCGSH